MSFFLSDDAKTLFRAGNIKGLQALPFPRVIYSLNGEHEFDDDGLKFSEKKYEENLQKKQQNPDASIGASAQSYVFKDTVSLEDLKDPGVRLIEDPTGEIQIHIGEKETLKALKNCPITGRPFIGEFVELPQIKKALQKYRDDEQKYLQKKSNAQPKPQVQAPVLQPVQVAKPAATKPQDTQPVVPLVAGQPVKAPSPRLLITSLSQMDKDSKSDIQATHAKDNPDDYISCALKLVEQKNTEAQFTTDPKKLLAEGPIAQYDLYGYSLIYRNKASAEHTLKFLEANQIKCRLIDEPVQFNFTHHKDKEFNLNFDHYVARRIVIDADEKNTNLTNFFKLFYVDDNSYLEDILPSNFKSNQAEYIAMQIDKVIAAEDDRFNFVDAEGAAKILLSKGSQQEAKARSNNNDPEKNKIANFYYQMGIDLYDNPECRVYRGTLLLKHRGVTEKTDQDRINNTKQGYYHLETAAKQFEAAKNYSDSLWRCYDNMARACAKGDCIKQNFQLATHFWRKAIDAVEKKYPEGDERRIKPIADAEKCIKSVNPTYTGTSSSVNQSTVEDGQSHFQSVSNPNLSKELKQSINQAIAKLFAGQAKVTQDFKSDNFEVSFYPNQTHKHNAARRFLANYIESGYSRSSTHDDELSFRLNYSPQLKAMLEDKGQFALLTANLNKFVTKEFKMNYVADIATVFGSKIKKPKADDSDSFTVEFESNHEATAKAAQEVLAPYIDYGHSSNLKNAFMLTYSLELKAILDDKTKREALISKINTLAVKHEKSSPPKSDPKFFQAAPSKPAITDDFKNKYRAAIQESFPNAKVTKADRNVMIKLHDSAMCHAAVLLLENYIDHAFGKTETSDYSFALLYSPELNDILNNSSKRDDLINTIKDVAGDVERSGMYKQ